MELPLAFPVILTGIRIVLVQNIGLAVIAGLIGGGGLGHVRVPGHRPDGHGPGAARRAAGGALAFAAAIVLDAAGRGQPAAASERTAAMIEIEGLTKIYGDTAVVDDVSMTVARARSPSIVGTSGSGKTTLLRMINRLVEPTSGACVIDGGGHGRGSSRTQLRRRIGYAIQGHGLFPHRTVAQNIATVPRLLGWDKARIASARRRTAGPVPARSRTSFAIACRTSCPAASSSASALRARSPPSRTSC